jgi:hypothetical protein
MYKAKAKVKGSLIVCLFVKNSLSIQPKPNVVCSHACIIDIFLRYAKTTRRIMNY